MKKNKSLILVIAVLALVVVAGCTGNGNTTDDGGTTVDGATTPDGTTTTDETTTMNKTTSPDATTSPTGTATDGTADETPDSTNESTAQYTHFRFEQGERYEYDVRTNGQEGTLVWEVTDTSGDHVTVHTSYRVGDVSFETTATGTETTIKGSLVGTPAGGFMRVGVFHPIYDHYHGHDLTVGNSWGATTSLGSATYSVTGTDSYAGVRCYTTEVRVNGVLRHEGCVSPDHGLVVYSAIYDQTGTQTVEMQLRQYDPTDRDGVGNGDEGSPGDGDGDSDSDSDSDEGDNGDGHDAGDGASGQYTHFVFEQGERYEYEVRTDGQEGTLVWEVIDTSDDHVTVSTSYQVGGVSFETTATGTETTIEETLVGTPAGGFMRVGVFHPLYDHYDRHELRVGNSWSATTALGSATYSVTGTDSYAGVRCYTTEVRVNGMLRHEGCVSPDLGLVVYSAIYDRSGTKTVEMELVQYTNT